MRITHTKLSQLLHRRARVPKTLRFQEIILPQNNIYSSAHHKNTQCCQPTFPSRQGSPRTFAKMSAISSSHSHACCTVPPVVAAGYKEKGKYITVDGMKTCKSARQLQNHPGPSLPLVVRAGDLQYVNKMLLAQTMPKKPSSSSSMFSDSSLRLFKGRIS